jgi:hypothetical protein
LSLSFFFSLHTKPDPEPARPSRFIVFSVFFQSIFVKDGRC